MKYRRLGKTGIIVSEIGFGTWGIGGVTEGATSYGETDDAESLRTLEVALHKGINFYDTSNIYGDGHAEELLAKAFGSKRDKVVIATKVGFTKYGGPHNIYPDYIRECLEESLTRLKTDYVDLYQIHSVPIEMAKKNLDWLETMRALKKEGKIRSFGYSVENPADAIIAIEDFGIDAVQVNFNMIDQRVLDGGVFESAHNFGAGVIARTPFCFGFLTGSISNTHFDSRDHRSTWSEDQLKRWKEAPVAFASINQKKIYTPAQLALKFCMGFSEVSTVIPGMLKVEEVEENVLASDLPPLTTEQFVMINKINRENKFFIDK